MTESLSTVKIVEEGEKHMESSNREMARAEGREAVNEAVEECIQDGILADFLAKNRDEVVDACLMEFEQMYYAESLLEEGRKTGMEEGVKQLVAQMLSDGKTPNEIHDFCHISPELIESVQKEQQHA
jgi:hypothetical protein